MRLKLALYFMSLALLLHFVGSSVGIILLNAGLERSTDNFLKELVSEVMPAIQIVDSRPTLKNWVERLREDNLRILSTIQIFDKDRQLLEHYGPPGVPLFFSGRLEGSSLNGQLSVRSCNQLIRESGKIYGYVQIQEPTRQNDSAILQAIYAALLVMPVLGVLVALAGYWFASIALKPVEQTMHLLRRFIADAGHELNTPIAIIAASLETLQETLREHSIDGQELTSLIAAATARMSELASDLIFLARVEDPMLAYPFTPIRIGQIVEDVARDYQILAAQKHLQLQVANVDESEVNGNAEFLRRMIGNLLSNSLRYTDAGGRLEISSRSAGNQVEIAVSDTGIGIPADCLAMVFDRFFRVDKARARAEGGAGLGLSIVRAVVETHKGTVNVTSTVGQGTTFTISLPLIKRPGKAS
jgi:signal transduction histidine kinase